MPRERRTTGEQFGRRVLAALGIPEDHVQEVHVHAVAREPLRVEVVMYGTEAVDAVDLGDGEVRVDVRDAFGNVLPRS